MSTWRQTKRSDVLGSSAPGSRCASHSTWKPLQMPSTGPPSLANAIDRLHQRREARDRADAQVVAVGEAAGDDDRVDAAAGRGRRARAAARRRRARAASSASRSSQRARELDDAELHSDDLVVLDQRVGQQLLAHRVELRLVLDVELDQPPDVDVRHAARSPSAGSARSTAMPCGSRMPCLRADQDARPHGAGPREPRVERLAGDLLVGLDVARARALDDVLGHLGRRRRLVPARSPTPSRARTACRSSAGRGPARSVSAGQ